MNSATSPPHTSAPEQTRDTNVRRRPDPDRVFAILTPALFLVLWEVVSRSSLVDVRFLSPPSAVAATFIDLVADGEIFEDIRITVIRFTIGTTLGLFPGLFIGLTLGLFRLPRAVFKPLVMLLYPIPRIALFPLVLLFVGLNERSNMIMIAIGPFFTMAITAMAAVLDIDPIYRQVARSFQTGTWDLYRLVTMPAALPVIMGGARVAVGQGLLATIAVEFLVGSSGIGYIIWRSWQVLSLETSLVGLVLGGLLGVLIFTFLDWLERRIVPWQTTS